MARGGWIADYLDPFSFLDLFSIPEGNNASGWYDPAYVRLLRDANREPDPMRRFELLSRAEKLLLEAQPVIPLYTNDTSFMTKPYVKGLYGNPLTIHPWQHVYIEHDPAKWN